MYCFCRPFHYIETAPQQHEEQSCPNLAFQHSLLFSETDSKIDSLFVSRSHRSLIVVLETNHEPLPYFSHESYIYFLAIKV